jgi:hypothetical protein
MAFIKLENCSQQILKGMQVSAPEGAFVFDAVTDEPIEIKQRTVFHTTGNNRKGIGRYRINMTGPDGRSVYCMNYMMDDNKKKYHEVWRLEQEPYTAADIFRIYGYQVTEDHQRARKYKLTGRVRALKIAKALRDNNRHAEADLLIKNMEAAVSKGRRFICHWPADLVHSKN